MLMFYWLISLLVKIDGDIFGIELKNYFQYIIKNGFGDNLRSNYINKLHSAIGLGKKNTSLSFLEKTK